MLNPEFIFVTSKKPHQYKQLFQPDRTPKPNKKLHNFPSININQLMNLYIPACHDGLRTEQEIFE